MKTLFVFLLAGCFLAVAAATPSTIGMVKSTGDFRLDGSTVRGNSTLFEGNLIETAASRSVVELNGAKFTLSPKSRAKMYHDRAVLEQGTGIVKDAAYGVEAATLRIAPASKDAVIQVELTSPKTVSVFARGGSAEVRNASGLLVASLRPGMGLAFTPQGNSQVTKITGKVVKKNGTFQVVDATTNVTIEITGKDFSSFVGKTVEITGKVNSAAKPSAGATQVVDVATIAEHKGGAAGKAGVAGAAGAAGAAAGAAAAGGVAAATTVAVVGGVAAAATVGGLAAAGALPGQGDESASR